MNSNNGDSASAEEFTMTQVAKKIIRIREEVRKNHPKVSKHELDARWIYANTAIEYPDIRLKDARAIVRKKA